MASIWTWVFFFPTWIFPCCPAPRGPHSILFVHCWGQLAIICWSIHIVALDLWPQDVGPSVVMDFELIYVLTKEYPAYRKVF